MPEATLQYFLEKMSDFMRVQHPQQDNADTHFLSFLEFICDGFLRGGLSGLLGPQPPTGIAYEKDLENIVSHFLENMSS